VPKQLLTGDSTERVHTPVLQVIFRFDRGELPIFIGQPMDIFMDTQTHVQNKYVNLMRSNPSDVVAIEPSCRFFSSASCGLARGHSCEAVAGARLLKATTPPVTHRPTELHLEYYQTSLVSAYPWRESTYYDQISPG